MADNVEIQGLEFQIIEDSTDAVKSLEKLKSTLEQLKSATKGGVSGVRTAAKQISKLKESLSAFTQTEVQMLKDIAGGLKALGSVGQVKISSSIANQITSLKTALSGISADTTARLSELTTALSSLGSIGKNHLNSLFNQLKRIPEVVAELDKVDMSKFTQQMTDLAAAMKPFADEMAKVAAGFSAFPSKIQKLIASTEKYNNTVHKATKRTNSFSTALKNLNFAGVLYALRRIASFLGDCITESNEYQENLNLFTVAMGEYAEQALEYAKTVSEAMGIDVSDWIRAQGVFNTLLTGFGNVADRAAVMSQNLTQLGYDLSSFFNISVEDAMQKLQSGISGELEPLRRLGYDLSQARLEAVALSLGIDKSVASMTQAEKAELRYYAIMTQVTTAQGDLARTLESPANQLRVLQAQLSMCAREIGNVFIPALNAILPYAIAVVQAIREIAAAVAELFGFTLTEVDYSGIDSVTDSATDSSVALEDAAEAAEELKNATAGFDELNIISDDAGNTATDPTAGAGSGFDFELPTYDFLGDAINTRVDEIKAQLEPFVTWVKEHLEEIGVAAAIIGTTMLGWKIAKAFMTDLSLVKEWMKLIKEYPVLARVGWGALGTVIAAIGASIEAMGIKSIMEDGIDLGNTLATILGGAGLTGGAAMIGKAIAGAAGAALGAGIGGIIAGIPAFIAGIYSSLKEGISWMSAALTAAGATAAGAGIGAIIGSLGGPIGAGIGALIGLAVGLIVDFGIWLYQNWESVCAWMSGIGDWVNTNVIVPVVEFFRGLWESVSGFFGNLWSDIQGIWNKVAGWFNTNVIKPLSSAFKSVTDWIGTFFEGCWIIVQAVWIVVSDWFTTNIIDPVRQKFEELTTKIKNFFSEAWAKVKEIWSAVSSWFNTNIVIPVQTKFQELTTKVKNFFSNAWTSIKQVWTSVTTWFQNTVINPLVQRFQTAWTKIKTAFENAFNGIKTFVTNIFNGIIGKVEGVINRVINGINGLIRGFNNVVNWAADIVGTDWRGLSTISLVSLPRLADGGFVDEGQLFIAREAGAEMVGSIGNRTSVANNDQIVEGIKAGVYEAVMAAFGSGGSNNQVVKVYLDGKEITANVEKHQRERGVSFMGGVVYG